MTNGEQKILYGYISNTPKPKFEDDIQLHEILKQASMYCYHGKNSPSIPQGYWPLNTIDEYGNNLGENPKTGFYADVITNGENIIIAYRGTDLSNLKIQDYINDAFMAHSDIPQQATDAIKLYDYIKRTYKNTDIFATGHSLGGSLGEIVSAVRGCKAVTFNAYGVRDMFKSGTRLKEDNLVNYVVESDPVSIINGKNHLGEIYSVPSYGNSAGKNHQLEFMGTLTSRKQKTPEEIEETAKQIPERYNDIKNTISNVIDEKNRYRDQFENNLNGFRHSLHYCPGSYPVSAYTRSDGRHVSEYIRKCGAKHNNQ